MEERVNISSMEGMYDFVKKLIKIGNNYIYVDLEKGIDYKNAKS